MFDLSLLHQWLKWFREAGGSPDEARLEQTPYPFQPTNLALFRRKITLYRFIQGAHTIAGGLKWEQGAESPGPLTLTTADWRILFVVEL